MASFIFGGEGMPKTPQELARRRKIAEALAANVLSGNSAPQNVGQAIGQGLGDIGQALAARRIGSRLDKAEKTGQDSANSAFNALLSGAGASPAPSVPSETPQGQAVNDRVSQAFSGDQQQFFGSLTPSAIKASQATGVDPRIILAQAALESGYGQHAPGNNLFGIKSHGQDGGNTLSTTEVVNGQPVQTQASFRAYDSPDASVMGYADFINNNPRYAAFKAADGLDAQVAALGQSGYATDPAYAQKVASIAKGIQLPGLDQAATRSVPGQPAPALAAPQSVATPPAPAAQPMAAPGPDMQAISQQFGGSQQLANADPRKGILTALLSGQQNGRAGFPAAPGQGGAQSSNPTMQALMKAMSNPWLNEGQKAVVGALLKQEIAKSDPNNALDAEYKRAQIDHLRNPTQDLPASVEEYNFYTKQELASGRQPLPYNDWQLQSKKAGATTINNNMAGGDFNKQLDKNVADSVMEQRSHAQDAANVVKIINEGRGLLDSGAITGAGANYKVGALKLAAALGVPVPQDAPNNTQAFQAVMGQAVGAIIKNFGAGTGLSDADRKYAERIAGGDVTLNEEAIRRIFDISEKAARARIEAWQKKVPDILKGDMGSMLNIPMPDVYAPPANGGTTSNGLQWSIEP